MNIACTTTEHLVEARRWASANIKPLLENLPPQVPNFAHCIGQDRCLGEYFFAFLSNCSTHEQHPMWADLAIVSIALRTRIVLDDYARDSTIDRKDFARLTDCCQHILDLIRPVVARFTRCTTIAKKILATSSNVMFRQYQEMARGALPSFDRTFGKCNHLALPINLAVTIDPEFPVDAVTTIIKKYLFVLQIIDDFADAEDDFSSPCNHNLFVWQMNDDRFRRFIDIRQALAPLVSIYLKTALDLTLASEIRQIESPTLFSNLFSRSQEYLNRWASSASTAAPDLWCNSPCLEEYVPPVAAIEKYDLLVSTLQARDSWPDLTGFRAESIHCCATKSAV